LKICRCVKTESNASEFSRAAYLCASLVNNPSIDSTGIHPGCHHQSRWPGPNNQDIDLVGRVLGNHDVFPSWNVVENSRLLKIFAQKFETGEHGLAGYI